jgi:hypothetical protein
MIRPARLLVVMMAGGAMSGMAMFAVTTMPTPAVATSHPAPAPPHPAFAAMDYYDQNCAHCHGPEGAFYGPTLGNDLTDAGLVKEVRDMANGPGNAPIKEEEIAAETAYHRSLIMRVPYVAITEKTPARWTGEATPGATITLIAGNQKIPATLTDWTWTADLPAGIDPQTIRVEAELAGKTTTLQAAEASYSSTTPLPPAKDRPSHQK